MAREHGLEPLATSLMAQAEETLLEEVGGELREMMPWLKDKG